MSSPMQQAALHDTFTLLNGAKRITLPGSARITVGLSANLDTQASPGGGTEQTELNEPTGEVSVQLTLWTHAQWLQFRDVLALLRRGTQQGGAAVFTCAHPEVASRRIKRLYFVSEQSSPYSPRTGYISRLTFKEQLKTKGTATPLDTGQGLILPGAATRTATTPALPDTSPEGQRLLSVGRVLLAAAPVPVAGTGGRSTASPGLCSAWVREAWMATHHNDRSLFGGSANETEGRFRAAGLYVPWGAAAATTLQAGSLVFFGHDPSGYGHVGIADGRGNVIGNNLVTYRQRGGLFDAAGRPTGVDKAGRPVDARGTVRIADLGTPTGIGVPVTRLVPKALVQGPAAPLRAPPSPARPSANVPPPPRP